jgi:hypothetical protein
MADVRLITANLLLIKQSQLFLDNVQHKKTANVPKNLHAKRIVDMMPGILGGN